MKKLILAMVFVFATGTIMNANSSKSNQTIKVIVANDYCIEQMHNTYEFMIAFTGDQQMASSAADFVFEDCESDVDAIPGYYD
jgi:hypothetical protein